jgi:hypothetical protein
VDFRLDTAAAPVGLEPRVPCPRVAETADRDLGPPDDGRGDESGEPPEEPDLACVADPDATRKRPDGQVQSDRRRETCRDVEERFGTRPRSIRLT